MLPLASPVGIPLDQSQRPAADEVPRPDKCRNADCPQQEAFQRFLELRGLDGAGKEQEHARGNAGDRQQPGVEGEAQVQMLKALLVGRAA